MNRINLVLSMKKGDVLFELEQQSKISSHSGNIQLTIELHKIKIQYQQRPSIWPEMMKKVVYLRKAGTEEHT